jgi:hypothetical protein
VAVQAVRDVRCMACARLLGRWVRLDDGREGFLPPCRGAPLMVVPARGGLRCTHCGGRAYFEETEPDDDVARLLRGDGA